MAEICSKQPLLGQHARIQGRYLLNEGRVKAASSRKVNVSMTVVMLGMAHSSGLNTAKSYLQRQVIRQVGYFEFGLNSIL